MAYVCKRSSSACEDDPCPKGRWLSPARKRIVSYRYSKCRLDPKNQGTTMYSFVFGVLAQLDDVNADVFVLFFQCSACHQTRNSHRSNGGTKLVFLIRSNQISERNRHHRHDLLSPKEREKTRKRTEINHQYV